MTLPPVFRLAPPEELRACKAHLGKHDIAITGSSDHGVSQSLYIKDPDDIEIELYVAADLKLWHDHPDIVATVNPIRL